MSEIFVQVNDERIKLDGTERNEVVAHIKRNEAKFALLTQHLEQQAAALASARTKLAALGLTDDEVSALLGG